VVGVLLSRTSAMFGVPALLTFLALGVLTGEEGIGRIFFDNYYLTFDISITALVLILFDGGFNTPAVRIRSGLMPALTLATRPDAQESTKNRMAKSRRQSLYLGAKTETC
jgi:cell volume regulation protein A